MSGLVCGSSGGYLGIDLGLSGDRPGVNTPGCMISPLSRLESESTWRHGYPPSSEAPELTADWAHGVSRGFRCHCAWLVSRFTGAP